MQLGWMHAELLACQQDGTALVWFKLFQQGPHTCQHLLPQAAPQPGLQEPCRAQHRAPQVVQAGRWQPSMQVTGQAGGPVKGVLPCREANSSQQRGQDTA